MKKNYLLVPLDDVICSFASHPDDGTINTIIRLKGHHVTFPAVSISDEEAAKFKLQPQSTEKPKP